MNGYMWLTCTALAILCGVYSVFVRKGVKAILGLIATFVFSAIMVYGLYGYNYVGILFLIIYVGAIAVLFIFIVMMVPTEQSEGQAFQPVAYFWAAALIVWAVAGLRWAFGFLDHSWEYTFGQPLSEFELSKFVERIPDINRLAIELYVHNQLLFYLCVIALLVVLMAAIALTSDRKTEEKNI